MECVQPPHFVEGFQKVLEVRRSGGDTSQGTPWVLRDLYEEAIRGLVLAFENGADIAILAPSTDRSGRKVLKIDRKLREAANMIANSRCVTYGAVYHTAFHRFLKSEGVLDRSW